MPSLRALPRRFYLRSPEIVARDLLGRCLVRRLGGERLVLRIVETEAYLGAGDRAAHTFGGRRTARVRSMYLGGGHAYVYGIYGMHCCLNVVCGERDSGTAVLLRAGEAVAGAERMAALRGLDGRRAPGAIAGGPGKLCAALAIDRALDGVSLRGDELWIAAGEPTPDDRVARGPRVGVAYAGAAARWPLRFAVAGHAEMSRPRLGPARRRSSASGSA